MTDSKTTDSKPTDSKRKDPNDTLRDADMAPDSPRLTPQGRTDPSGKGEDATAPEGQGKVKTGQPDKAEGEDRG